MNCRFIAEQVEIDFLALTFTRSGNDVREARGLLDELGLHHIKILAKAGRLWFDPHTMTACAAGQRAT